MDFVQEFSLCSQALDFRGRRWSEKGGCLLPRGRLLTITCSPVPNSWEEAAGWGRRSSPQRSSSGNYLLSSSRFLCGGGGVRKEVVSSPEFVFCRLPALQFQIPGRRWRGVEEGRLLLGGRLLSITCSPVPDSWEEAAGWRRSSPPGRSSSVDYLLSSSRFLGGGRGVRTRLSAPQRSSSVNYLLSSSRFLGGGGGVRKEVVSSSEVVFSTSKTHTVVTRTENSVAAWRCSEKRKKTHTEEDK